MAILGNTKITNLTLLDGIIGDLNPINTDVYNLGTSSLRWNNLYAKAIYGTTQAQTDNSTAMATTAYVRAAINALDVVAIAGAASKTLTSISETDGKISATYSDIAINESQVTWTNGTLYTIGDDVYIGDVNVAGHLGIKGKNGNTGIMFTTYNQSTNTTGGKITWDGSKFTITGTVNTNISGLAAKATSDGSGNNIVDTYLTKVAGVTNVAYDTTNKKITKTINGATSDVVSATTLKTAMALDKVENTALSSWTGSNKITNVGTITTGTWNATAIGAAYGGTGKTSLKDSANALINALDTGSSNLTANDYVITQYVGGGTTTTTYHRRPASAIRVGGLLTARKLKVALGSTTDATFDGTADQTSIPISGTLGVAHGGTGVTTAGANKVFAGPTTGDAVAPSFRPLDATDIPALAASKITSGTFDAARIPNLNWSKITAGKPTTLAGYGITDTIVKGNGRVFYGTCETAAGTVAKVVSCPSYDALTAGDILIVDFTVTNTGSVGSLTLNVNSTGAVSIKKQVNTSLSNLSHANELHKDTASMFVYNGTYWVFINGDYNSTYTVTDVWSNTAAATAAKVSSNSNYYALREDAWFEFTLRYGNTASGALTLNVNSTGAKPIYINGTASSASNHTLPAGKYLVYYDGTNYYFRTDDKITANITGSAGSVAWSNVTGKPTTISGYGITDAKIASGTITLGSNTITPVTSVNGHTGSSVSVTATDLGLGNAMHFVGTTTTAMSDGLTTANVTVNNATHTPAAGDLVLHDNREYVWTGSLWEKLGIDGSLQETIGKVLGVSYDASTATLYITCTENSTDVNAGTITDREYSI